GRLFVRGKREASRVAAALIAAGYSVRTHQANDERQAYWNQRLHPSDVIAAHRREEPRRRCEELVNDRCREELEEELYRQRVLAWHPELEEEDLEGGAE
ncbi:hypothetical protein CMI37_03465, partial [Candidatus Pacearchaeota archaeon]|nr:hypothetical protein [Candidatus Pacearchaeota archaeon]